MRCCARSLSLLTALLALPACSADSAGRDDPAAPDAGPHLPDASVPDADPHRDDVVVTAYRHHVAADTTGTAQLDLWSNAIVLLIADPQEASGFRTVVGSPGDGELIFTNVPSGRHTLKVVRRDGVPRFYVTAARRIELTDIELGSSDAVAVTTATPVTLDLDGMTPWSSDDLLYVHAFESGTEHIVQPGSKVGEGATALDEVEIDWADGYRWGGDAAISSVTGNFYVSHLSARSTATRAGDSIATSVATDVCTPADVRLAAGTSTAIVDHFRPIALDRRLPLRIDPAAYASAWGPSPSFASRGDIQLALIKGPAVRRNILIAPTLFEAVVPLSSPSTAITFAHGDPFPAPWTSAVVSSQYNTRWVGRPGSDVHAAVSDRVMNLQPPVADMTVQPGVLPARGLRIAGVVGDVPGAVPFDGETPIAVSWDSAATAQHYEVLVQEVLPADGPALRAVARLATTATEVRVPADVLVRGTFYVVTVESIRGDADLDGGRLLRLAGWQSFASVTSAVFRFDASCGNGVEDAGEECDTAGASATCDADCSLPTCGDTVLNTRAGEVCDGPGDSPTCDFDCTPTVCGDNVENRNAGETCDDGNTVDDDNGCSSSCRVTSVCGDGRAQWGESCDDDDTDSGDGCSSTCQIEEP